MKPMASNAKQSSREFLGNFSMKNKLMVIIMLVSMVTMLLASVFFIAYQWVDFRRRLVNDLSTQAAMIADNSTAAISFNDTKDAQGVLNSLRAKPPIEIACLYRSDNSILATYFRDTSQFNILPTPEKPGHHFSAGKLVLFHTIMMADQPIGTVYIQSDLSELTTFINHSLLALTLMTIFMTATALIAASKLQGAVSRPLVHLTDTIRQISEEKDFSLRALKSTQDEIGLLTDSFNEMLSEIELRDTKARASEERFRTLVDQAADAVIVHDMTGNLLDVNIRACDSLGFTRQELLTMPLWQIDIAQNGQQEWEKIWNNLPPTHPITMEGLHQCKDGSTFPVEVRLGLLDLLGRPAVLALARDITERKQAELELRRLRNLLSNIINSMPSVLIGVDAEERVTHWNKGAEEMTGKTSDEAQGHVLGDVFPQLTEEITKVKKAIQQREIIKESKIAHKKKNEMYYSDITVYPLITNGLEGAVIRMDDVTERVRIEEIMIQAEKMLSVGGLAAGMAHEINNPLAGIMQNLQVLQLYFSGSSPKNKQIAEECGLSFEGLQEYMEKREAPKIIQSVLECGSRAKKIVDNMLSFSRKSEKGFAERDMAKLLDLTVELAANDYNLKKKYDFRQIEIIRQYDENIPEVFCEASQIQQVFLNIFKNGAQALSEDKRTRLIAQEGYTPQIILRLAIDDEMVRIEIEDNGPGMDETTRKRMFEPFFTTKDVGVGTGLGLSVSYFIIAENHHGQMEAESSLGNGCKIIIRLPIVGKKNSTF